MALIWSHETFCHHMNAIKSTETTPIFFFFLRKYDTVDEIECCDKHDKHAVFQIVRNWYGKLLGMYYLMGLMRFYRIYCLLLLNIIWIMRFSIELLPPGLGKLANDMIGFIIIIIHSLWISICFSRKKKNNSQIMDLWTWSLCCWESIWSV